MYGQRPEGCLNAKFPELVENLVGRPEGCAAIHKGRLKKWPGGHLVKEKRKVLPLGRNNQPPQNVGGLSIWRAAWQERSWGSWWMKS